jgi:hypothetical protein
MGNACGSGDSEAAYVAKNLTSSNIERRCLALRSVYHLSTESLAKNADKILSGLRPEDKGHDDVEVRRASIFAAKLLTAETLLEPWARIRTVAIQVASEDDDTVAMTALQILDKLEPQDLEKYGFCGTPMGGEIGSLLNYTGMGHPERRVAVLKLLKKLDPKSHWFQSQYNPYSQERKDILKLRDDENEQVREAARAIELVDAEAG